MPNCVDLGRITFHMINHRHDDLIDAAHMDVALRERNLNACFGINARRLVVKISMKFVPFRRVHKPCPNAMP